MRLHLLTEGYGRVYGFGYDKFKEDPRPKMLLLGKWRHPNTRNILLGGINLNYLSDDQVIELRKALPAILRNKNLKARFRQGKKLLPDIFGEAYRTYDRDWVGQVTRDTLKFYPSTDELDQAAEVPPTPPQDPSGVSQAVPATGPEAQVPQQAQMPEVQTPEKPQQPENLEVGQAAPSQVQPEVEKAPAQSGLRPPAEAPGRQAGAPPPAAPEAEEPEQELPMTSAQKRRSQAQDIKQAIDQQKEKKEKDPEAPKKKVEPPEEVKGVLGMFKKKPK